MTTWTCCWHLKWGQSGGTEPLVYGIWCFVVVQPFSCVWLFSTPHGRQHIRLPCPSLSPGACSNSCPLSRWCHPTMLFSCPLLLPSIFPSIRVFSNESALCIRWPKIGALASASVLPVNIQGWFPLGLIGLISLMSKGLLRVFFNTTVWKHQFFSAQPSLLFNSHTLTWILEKL